MSTEQPQESGHKKPPIPTPAKKVPAYNIEKRGDRLYPVESLHKWFAISSLLLFILTVGMVMQDYSREWKRYQREFNEISVRNTRDEAIGARNAVDVARYQQLGREMREAEAALAQGGGRVSELEGQIRTLTARWTRVDQDYRFTKAEFDADRYAYEEALARNTGNVDSLKAKSDATERTMDQYFLDREVVNTELQAAKDELAAMQTKITENRRQRETMRADYERLVRQFNTLNPGALVTSVINAPLMDFMRPSLQVKQILLPNLFYDQPFKQISRADRCTTCHLGIDNRKYENEAQPFKTHPNLDLYLSANSPHGMEQFGCTSCHGGLDRATDFQTAGHTPRTQMQQEDWIFKYGWHYDHYLETPMLSMPNIEAGCYKCHSASPEVPRAQNLNNGRDLIRMYGCFGCHKMPGYEGVRKVGPDLGTVSGKLTKDWVKKWLANPRDFKSEARMPKFWFNTNNSGVLNGIDWDKRGIAEINAITEFLWSKSTATTLPAKNTSGNVARGKELVEIRGCFGCHAIGPIAAAGNRTQTRRQHGYNLASQGSKVTANWIANWVTDPRQVWADSKMPSLRLTDSEVADITAYLSSLKNAQWDAKAAPETDTAALDGVVFEFLRAGSTEAKAKTDLAAMSTEQKNLYAGERLIGRYGCYACHNVPGFERAQPIGTELTEAGSKLISQLDFGFLKKADGSQVTHLDVEHQRGNWYTEKLKNPRVFDEGRIKRPDELLKMPNFGFREDEIRSIVMVLTSMVKDQVPLQMRDRTDPDIAAGRQLVAEKNCKGCHIIETLGGDIRAVVQQNVQWPPDLNTQGQKTQPEWLRGFLKDPGATQPRWWMDTRMPTFHFTEHEITVIGKYFASLDNVDWGWIDTTLQTTPQRLAAGKQLFDVLECLKCHPTSAAAAGNAAGLAPNLGLAQGRLRPEWIVRWLLDPQQVAPNTSMPTFFAIDGATGRRKTQAPGILEGNVDAQIQAIRDHVFSLGGGGRVRTGN